MKFTKILALVLVVLMVFSFAVACGKKDDTKQPEEQNSSSSSTSKKAEEASSSSSTTKKQEEPQGPYELVYDSNFNLSAGDTKEIAIDLTKIDTTTPILVTFKFAHDGTVSGGLEDNAIFSINGRRALRCSGGNATHILNPSTNWTSSGAPGWWGYQGANYAIDPETGYCENGPKFECEIDVANGTCDFKATWGGKDEETGETLYNLKATFDNTVIDFTGNTLTLKFGGVNTNAMSITNLNIDAVIK